MKIAAIRNAIDCANWTRQDLTGGTRDEFIRQDVGGSLGRHIAELRALEIAPRFARDIERRDDAIRAAEAVIARWKERRAEDNGHRAVEVVAVTSPAWDSFALTYSNGIRQACSRETAQQHADRLGVAMPSDNVIDFAAARAARMARIAA